MEQNIEFSGFGEIDEASRELLMKKAHDAYEKFTGKLGELHHLKFTLKKVHEREKSEKYEIHGQLEVKGKMFTSEVTDRNLIVCFDAVVSKIDSTSG